MEIGSGITELFSIYRGTDGGQAGERTEGQSDFDKHSAGVRMSLEVDYTMLFLMQPEFSNRFLQCIACHMSLGLESLCRFHSLCSSRMVHIYKF